MERIPKVIHYCWFGGNEMPNKMKKLIEHWKEVCPTYVIKCWNEDNFDVNSVEYVREAYQAKKWAFVTDYVRLYALFTEGGIYMDSDVELLKDLDCFLSHSAFTGYESSGYPLTAVMGAEKEHPWIKLLLDSYEGRHFINADGTFEVVTNTETTADIMKREYHLVPNGEYVELKDGLVIYPADWFCPKSWETDKICITDNTVAIHHFNASWWDEKEKKLLQLKRSMQKFVGKKIATKIYYRLLSFQKNNIG